MGADEELARRAASTWNARADAWDGWTGPDGDPNRRLNSDPVLWRLLGDVAGRDLLDAGCGAGYLSVALARARARSVVAIDVAPRMVEHARRRAAEAGVAVDARVDSASALATVADRSIDALVSNYVLMDLPDLDGAARAFARVLRPGGRAVVIVSHPCFSAPGGADRHPDGSVTYRWPRSYFEERAFEERWGPFEDPFLVFHRPLARYWQAFTAAGLTVETLEEPIVSDPPPPGADLERVRRMRMTPYSLAFALRAPVLNEDPRSR